MKINEIYEGEIINVKQFGAFVKIGEEIGMIHISEVSDNFVSSIDDYFLVGDKVKVLVIGKQDSKYSLSFKRVEENFTNVAPGFGSIRKKLPEWIEEKYGK